MTVGELFAGIGGLSLGLERAGFEVAWQVECDDYATTILERHWPHVPRRRDVRLADATNLAPVDCIAGGFPCQDISCAGKGEGLGGRRSGLWREFARLVRELRPRWVIAENVPALRTRGADVVLSELEAAGYACWPIVVGARHVGAPHRRDRVFIVGRMADASRGRCDGRPTHEQPGRAEAQGPGACRVPDPEGQRRASEGERRDAQIAGAGAARADGMADTSRDALRNEPGRGGGSGRPGAAEPRHDGAHLAHGHGGRREGERRGGLRHDERASCGNDADGCGEWAVGDADEGDRERWAAAGEQGQAGSPSRRWRWPAGPGLPQQAWEPSRTVQTQPRVGKGLNGLPARLAARRRRNELKALGNAVVPQVAELIGRAVLAVESALRHEVAA